MSKKKHPNSPLIKGMVGGVRVWDVDDPLLQKILVSGWMPALPGGLLQPIPHVHAGLLEQRLLL